MLNIYNFLKLKDREAIHKTNIMTSQKKYPNQAEKGGKHTKTLHFREYRIGISFILKFRHFTS